MKSTGITRQVDTLGRVVLPKELRRNMGLDVNDAMEIYVDGDSIILKKSSGKNRTWRNLTEDKATKENSENSDA